MKFTLVLNQLLFKYNIIKIIKSPMKERKILIINKLSIACLIYSFLFHKVYIIDTETKIIKIMDRIGLKINKFIYHPNAKTFEDFDNFDISSREEVSKVIHKFGNKNLYNFLLNFMDSVGAKSFLIKAGYHYLHLNKYMMAKKFINSQYKNVKIFLVFKNEITIFFNFSFIFNYNFFFRAINKLFIILFVYKNNLKFKNNKPDFINEKFEIATEVSNPKFFKSRFGEANYLNNNKLLLYRSHNKNVDIDADKAFNNFINATYLDLRFIKLDKDFLLKLKSCLLTVDNFFSYDQKFFQKMIHTHSEISNLLKSTEGFQYLLVLESTNDLRFINLECGLITHIANINNVKTLSYQTRSPYCFEPLSFFSYYDHYFAWSEFWFKKKDKYNFIKNYHYTSPFKHEKKLNFISSSNVISLFPAEINNNIYSSELIFKDFLNLCFSLCLKYPNYIFKFKPKYSDQIDKYIADSIIPDNFSLVDPDVNFIEMIKKSNLVISSGFTATGFIALAKGIKSLYYTTLDKRELSSLPIVYTSKKKLESSFLKYLDNSLTSDFIYSHKLLFNSTDDHKTIIAKTLKIDHYY